MDLLLLFLIACGVLGGADGVSRGAVRAEVRGGARGAASAVLRGQVPSAVKGRPVTRRRRTTVKGGVKGGVKAGAARATSPGASRATPKPAKPSRLALAWQGWVVGAAAAHDAYGGPRMKRRAARIRRRARARRWWRSTVRPRLDRAADRLDGILDGPPPASAVPAPPRAPAPTPGIERLEESVRTLRTRLNGDTPMPIPTSTGSALPAEVRDLTALRAVLEHNVTATSDLGLLVTAAQACQNLTEQLAAAGLNPGAKASAAIAALQENCPDPGWLTAWAEAATTALTEVTAVQTGADDYTAANPGVEGDVRQLASQ